MRSLVVLLGVLVYTNAQRTSYDDLLQDSCFVDPANCCFAESKWAKRKLRCEKVNGTYPCAIKLGVSAWMGSFMNVYLAKTFIEEFLGYPVLISADAATWSGFTEIRDVTAPDGSTVLGMLSELELGTVGAILEVWPYSVDGTLFDYTFKRGTVVEGGPLGVIGQSGWYVGSFLLEDHDPFLEFWRTMTKPGKAELLTDPLPNRTCCTSNIFASKGMPCMPSEDLGGLPVSEGGIATSVECDADPDKVIPTSKGGRLLISAPDWGVHDVQIVKNLGLNLTIEYAVSVVTLFGEIFDSVQNKVPKLFKIWAPNSLLQAINLTRVVLPKYSRDCADRFMTGGYDCDFDVQVLKKLYSRKLVDDMPDASFFIDVFQYSNNEQQESMLTNNLLNQGKSLNQVACEWIEANKEVWDRWTTAVQTKFENQTWKGENYVVPVFVGCECSPTTPFRDVVKYFKAIDVNGVKVVSDPDPCFKPTYSTYSHRWLTTQLETELIEQFPCSYIHSDRKTMIVVTASVAISYLMLLLAGIVFHHKSRAVVAARVRTILAYLGGCILLNVPVLFTIGKPTFQTCALRVVCFVFGGTFFVGALLIKQILIHQLMKTKTALSRSAVSRRTMFMRFQVLTLTIVAFLLLLLWAFVGFEPVDRIIPGPNPHEITETVCPTNDAVSASVFAVAFVAMTISCMLAYQSSQFTFALVFKESKFLMISSYTVAVISTFTAAGAFSDALDATEKSRFVAVSIAVSTAFSATLVAGTRIFAANKGMTSGAASTGNSGKTGATLHTSVSTMGGASVAPEPRI